jgi:tetratricopeptide (TPR) repeat protein
LGFVTEPTPFERAQSLLQRGQIEEAIFICRTVLFNTLTSLAQAARISRTQTGDQDERAYQLNDALANMGVYAEPLHKQVQHWISLGQLGVDGATDQLTIGDVGAMITDLAQFTRLVTVSLDMAQTDPAPGGEPSVPRVRNAPPPRPQAVPPPRMPNQARPRELTAPGMGQMPFPLGDQAPAVIGTLPRVPGFVGRGLQVQRLAGLLRQGRHVALVPIEAGIAGIGLSAVASETLAVLAQDTPSAFPGGMLALHGFGRQGEEALRWVYTEIGATWQVPAIAQAGSLTSQEREVRRVLLNRQALIVIDEVELGLPVQRLLDTLAASGATVLFTSRQVPRAEQLSVMRLDALADGPALSLLQERYASSRGEMGDWNEDVARSICALLENRPLALELAATLASGTLTLTTLAQRLEYARNRGLLVNRSDPNQGLRYVLDLVVSGMDTSEQNCYAALAIFAGASWTEDAARAVIGAVEASFTPAESQTSRAEQILQQFVRRHLVQTGPSAFTGLRYRLQPFIRSSLAHLLVDRPVITDWAGHAMAAYYAGVALARRKATDREALQEDYVHLEAGLQWAHAHNEADMVVSYGMGLYRYWQRQGLWQEAETYLNWAVRAAQVIGDRPREAQLAQELGAVANSLGQKNRAQEWYERALAIWRSLGNARNEAAALFDLGRMAQEDDDLDTANAYYDASLKAAREDDDNQGQGRALQALGLIAESRGQIEEARRCYELVFEMRQQAGDTIGQAGALNVLGVLEYRQHHFPAAQDHLAASLKHAQLAQNEFWQAEAYFWLGETAVAMGDARRALAEWQRALQLYIHLGRKGDAEETQRRLTRLLTPPG